MTRLGVGDPTCPLCALSGEAPDIPDRHGVCLLRASLGGVGAILDPEGQRDDPDAGLTPRQSALAVGVLMRRVSPDDLVDQSWADLELRRRVLDTIVGAFLVDIEVIAKLMPAMHQVLMAVFGIDGDDGDEDGDDEDAGDDEPDGDPAEAKPVPQPEPAGV
jgi:hypothetical protein